jgi:hypothetical protein
MARRDRERDPRKERFWRDMIRRWRRSGWTIRAFCAEHRLSEPSFYAWRRILAQRDQQATSAAAWTDGRYDDLPAFVPLGVTPDSTPPVLEIIVDSGRVVRVPPGFDVATLRNLLAVLEETPSC